MKRLFKFIATSLTILMLAACVKTNNSAIYTDNSNINTIDSINEASVALMRESGGAYCGGTWVSKHYILTARHCLEDLMTTSPVGNKIYLKTHKELNKKFPSKDKGKYTATVHSVDEGSDTALVFAKAIIPHKIAVLRRSEMLIGERLHIIGHPSGFEFTYMSGTVSQIRYYTKTYVFSLFSIIEMEQKIIQVNSDVWFGNSGGGAFDSKGRLVGVASFIRQARGMSFFVHNDMITKYLVKKNVKFTQR